MKLKTRVLYQNQHGYMMWNTNFASVLKIRLETAEEPHISPRWGWLCLSRVRG